MIACFKEWVECIVKENIYGKTPNIVIYDNHSGGSKVVDPEIYQYSLEQIVRYDGEIILEEDKQQMIENIFDLEKNKRLKESKYYSMIKKKIELLEGAIPNRIAKREIESSFRDIQSILLIPDNVYEQLNNTGKIEEWNKKMHTKGSMIEKIKIKEEISNYTISVTWNPYLEYDTEELFYLYSNIHRTRYRYEFDEETLQGRGLIKQVEKDNFD